MKMPKILFVDDEVAIRQGFKEYAEFLGYDVVEASDGMDAIELCRHEDFDIIIMDIMMPKVDGYTAIKQIKQIKDIPIIMLSARNEEYDKLFGFEVGVDDYVTKPFSIKELMARIRVILKRNQKGQDHEVYTFESLMIDITSRSVYLGEKKLEMTPKEYDLLFYLVRNKNIALSREQLLNEVWGMDFYGDDRTVDTHIKTLRQHLEDAKSHIVTLRGVGYRFED